MTKSPMRLILSNLRSAGNVGQILRTADAAGVETVCACGYTPYPQTDRDSRPPHISIANQRAIAKTALGAELSVPVLHYPDTITALREAKSLGFKIIIVEQAENALNLFDYNPPLNQPFPTDLEAADAILELPMLGRKESLNVAATVAIALYYLRFAKR
jgi:23S rRNA (guanosine2251-2'-O)-methyltransferase